jgi:hypothetical protein
MQRILFWILVALLGIGLGALLFLKFTVPQEDSTVYLKAGSGEPIVGYVTEKENYIVVTKDGFQRIYPWDEIKTISGPKPLPSKSAAFGYWLDKLDFLSSLGVLAALVVFSAGLYQYQQGLVWKREEFLASVLAANQSQDLENAKKMLESLAQDRSANIQTSVDENSKLPVYATLTKADIIAALADHVETPTVNQLKIRNAFDYFLDRFEILDGYIHLRVVAKRSVYVQTGYWLELLGRYDKLDLQFRKRLLDYAKFYRFDGFLKIIGRYNRLHRFHWWIKEQLKPSKARKK